MYSQNNSKVVESEIELLKNKFIHTLQKHNLVIDSRNVKINDIFCAYKGYQNDGCDFIDNAIKNGASMIFADRELQVSQIPHYTINNLMQYVGILAALKFNIPSKNFTTIGVTGTNGKTSITHWINQMFMALKFKTAIIGTTGIGVYPDINEAQMTTPDPISLQKILYDFSQQHVKLVAMEVSSHALDQGRVNGVYFNTAIFTNLTLDHLDYHKTIENYFHAKQSLFYWKDLQNAIINIDDPFGRRLAYELNAQGVNIITYGIYHGDFQALGVKINLNGSEFVVKYKNNKIKLNVPIIGKFNIYNILAVIATLVVHDIDLYDIVNNIHAIYPVCGRMDTIIVAEKPLVVIDYAHTPDALENVLLTLNEIVARKKIYCVFGCGGNRDISKRSIMGQIATMYADYVYVTSDNPRDEDPESIINDITYNLKKNNFVKIVDRRQAILQAIKNAKMGDIILIAGKGHENYQEIKGKRYAFSDFEIARTLLKA